MGGCALKHNTMDCVWALPASIGLLQGAQWVEMGGQSGVELLRKKEPYLKFKFSFFFQNYPRKKLAELMGRWKKKLLLIQGRAE